MYVKDSQVRETATPTYDVAAVERRWQETWAAAGPPSGADGEETAAAVVAGREGAADHDESTLAHVRDCVVADAHARFRRASGDAVLLALSAPPAQLGLSLDIDLEKGPCGPVGTERVQRRFLELLAAGRLHHAGDGTWRLRARDFDDDNHRGIAALAGWPEAALAAQREAVGRVEGVEVDAATLDGRKLKLFSTVADAVPDSVFALMSPRHPDVDRWVTDAQREPLAALCSGAHEDPRATLAQDTVLVTGVLLRVEGIGHSLPLVLSTAVDARFGPTAVLGIPKVERYPQEVLDRLCGNAANWDAGGKRIRTRAAVRFRCTDVPVSVLGAPGRAPVPVVLCDACGDVPVAEDQLPLASAASRDCPRCGATAVQDPGTIDFGPGAWAQRIAVAVRLHGTADARAVLAERTVAMALHGAAPEQSPAGGEPYASALLTGDVDGGPSDAAVGADALRLALLHAAAPATSVTFDGRVLDHCARFLDRLWDFAEPRLRAAAPDAGARIDASNGRRRRLAFCCATGRQRITENLESLQTHRATRNMMLLLERIEAFEARATAEAGAPDRADTLAVAAALRLLLRLAEPVVPHVTHELWAASGAEQPLGRAPWPRAAAPAPAAETETPAPATAQPQAA
ncbi:MAG TPA: class I tRNA ligase family protein [Baekduia sp.]|uniref:class I tRNA ligase family protein n=1 Tax=Baekduia sp. TaxID=2600305 RepID=UPI002CFE2A35|nr:class I tRNA ligase family protein [Baekduia sp.]HMJ32533.1 class I tRNA ligase family protein [Baekduia sp.]